MISLRMNFQLAGNSQQRSSTERWTFCSLGIVGYRGNRAATAARSMAAGRFALLPLCRLGGLAHACQV